MTANHTTETAASGSGPHTGDDIHARNAALRMQWLELMADANTSTDEQEARRLREQAGQVADEFVRANYGLAVAGSGTMLNHAESSADREDHHQAALMGLWQAFVGTTPDALAKITRDENGEVVSPAGWDVQRTTFGTTSRAHIRGQVMRSVRRESQTAHMSYGAWSQRPRIIAAKEALIGRGIPSPSYEQIAAEAGVDAGQVRLILTPSAVSLDMSVGGSGDDDRVLADKIADQLAAGPIDGDQDLLEQCLLDAARDEQTTLRDLAVYLLHQGVLGQGQPLAQIASLTGYGRGTCAAASKRFKEAVDARAEAVLARLRA